MVVKVVIALIGSVRWCHGFRYFKALYLKNYFVQFVNEYWFNQSNNKTDFANKFKNNVDLKLFSMLSLLIAVIIEIYI